MIIQFEGMETEISKEELEQEIFDVDFNGQQMVQFQKIGGLIIAINGMNGWGDNNAEEVNGKCAYIVP
jgi:hypothetical protein